VCRGHISGMCGAVASDTGNGRSLAGRPRQPQAADPGLHAANRGTTPAPKARCDGGTAAWVPGSGEADAVAGGSPPTPVPISVRLR